MEGCELVFLQKQASNPVLVYPSLWQNCYYFVTDIKVYNVKSVIYFIISQYQLEEERGDFIVYKPEGMRGMRAYIKTDSEKNYLAWSGPIKIADKSKFLRGDFENTEE